AAPDGESAMGACEPPAAAKGHRERYTGPPRRDIHRCVLLPPRAQMLRNTAVFECSGVPSGVWPVREYYARRAAEYDATSWDALDPVEREAVEGFVAALAPGRVLDIGCGTGYLTR